MLVRLFALKPKSQTPFPFPTEKKNNKNTELANTLNTIISYIPFHIDLDTK